MQNLNSVNLIQFVYFIAAILFIVGIKRLSSPSTARSGNQLAFLGMTMAVLATFADPKIHNYGMIVSAILIGGFIGAVPAYRVKMTDMPQMVAIFNGMGGGAAALLETSEFLRHAGEISPGQDLVVLLGAMIGYLTLSGSFIAFAKLQGLIPSGMKARFSLRFLFFILALTSWSLAILIFSGRSSLLLFPWLCATSFLSGMLFVLPVGGADMPVIISLLNAFTGLAVAFAGFALQNYLLLISGTLVGASGTLLTGLMCRAMNRPLAHVLFGAFLSGTGGSAPTGKPGQKEIQQISVEDAAILLAYAKQIIIVPGYGLAVAQAQHQVRQLEELLEKRGVVVKYAIHPVAGRMPGHMNVLLAEANVPYPKLFEMEEINPEFARTDVALVIGANDVVNPAARTKKNSPIYGMPILDVDRAEKILVLKRSMNPGFAGIENELFGNPKTYLLFGDAGDSLQKLTAAVKTL